MDCVFWGSLQLSQHLCAQLRSHPVNSAQPAEPYSIIATPKKTFKTKEVIFPPATRTVLTQTKAASKTLHRNQCAMQPETKQLQTRISVAKGRALASTMTIRIECTSAYVEGKATTAKRQGNHRRAQEQAGEGGGGGGDRVVTG